MSTDDRYPIPQSEYMQSVGRLLPHRIRQAIEAMHTNEDGFRVWVNPNQSNGVDLKVWHNNELFLVVEVLNWSIKSKISQRRKRCIIENLTAYDCRRVLIYTCAANEHLIADLPQQDIHIIRLGFQVLPKFFYDFFQAKDQINARRKDSKTTSNEIRTVLTRFLQS